MLDALKRKTAKRLKRALTARFWRLPKHLRLSFTYDNGCENVEHQEINRVLNTTSYFCNLFHSWEKGTVENRCGWLRRYWPKKTNLANISTKEYKRIENLHNNTPMKCLRFKTPKEVLSHLSVALRG
jgi:IS30 family transposase